ncbi:hypothetical protein OS493_024783 [Desmophyllum pertusum]|uniref:UspA domain-containing protein n=1 Tax=Desmophyllum pertusum TaxID=174260 RepID=A0A9X0CXL6_9CNID|nr:hypothetical protein OS493_024783 [Desmophyllum pertusum]
MSEERENTVIIAVDGSEHCKKAFDWYCGNLHKSSDKIVFTHAIDLERRPVVMHPHGMAFRDNFTHWLDKVKVKKNRCWIHLPPHAEIRSTTSSWFPEVGKAGRSYLSPSG